MFRRTRARLAAALVGGVAAVTAGAAGVGLLGAAPAEAARATPRNFTGYGFDQCVAPTQSAMDAWLEHSPFWAVGIYISGDSRGCRTQPNLGRAWVRTQLRKGWRLLPITLGPQASCSSRFPRYGDDETIDPSPRNSYADARAQGKVEAEKTVRAAKALGIGTGSTLWYDLEAFDIGRTDCRESALAFLSRYNRRLHALDYVSGVYSSAASGIRMLDDARVQRPGDFRLPEHIWIADWDGVANTSSAYIRNDGWLPGGRMKQYRGGHDEVWGGVRINIDSNFLDLGEGTTVKPSAPHCGGVRLSLASYPRLTRDDAPTRAVKAAQCLLTEQGYLTTAVNGRYGKPTRQAVRAFRRDLGMSVHAATNRRTWVALHAAGPTPLLKYGAGRDAVRRLQRALKAAGWSDLRADGIFAADTTIAVKGYQRALRTEQSGVVTDALWRRLQAGRS